MRIPQIRMSQTFAQLGIETEKPQQTIQQPKAEMAIQQQPTELKIERSPSILEIDQTRAWEEANLKGPATLARDWASASRQQGLEGIARRAEEGGQLAAIERGGNALADVAQTKSHPPPALFNITFIPSYGSVQFRFTPTKLDMNWTQGGVKIDAKSHQPLHEYKPGHVNIYLKQQESLTIEVMDQGLDVKV
ncbi:hypothetical protein BEP19_07485 [Ammoniphilus oxalaticus]|uniref:Uncharacterized protein n=1 Tax=Ammoniphilus oxalaticus TaxID=66863 RepID=A0A419SK11_9BACL|nr:DUF6470 family protein [Ammoniphilus oxalaticus]RKD24238.1 hypothetical protein BEP19_07485 [Ammoniphilus oxalaticus]